MSDNPYEGPYCGKCCGECECGCYGEDPGDWYDYNDDRIAGWDVFDPDEKEKKDE